MILKDVIDLAKLTQKTQLFDFVNRKHTKETFEKKSDLKKIDNVNLNFESSVVSFFSENLTPFNQHLAWKRHELKRAKKIHSSWSSKRVVKMKWIMNKKAI